MRQWKRRLYRRGDAWYRPAQDCTLGYGTAMVLNRVVRWDLEGYDEVEDGRIDPGWAPGVDRTHTFNALGSLFVLEFRASQADSPPNKGGRFQTQLVGLEAEVKDAMLSTKIRLALGDKMGSDGFKIGTEVADGVVTLEFAKDFANARRREASKVVENVAGVTKVISIEKA